MKTLAELRFEVEIGLRVYPSNHPDLWVFRAEGWYVFGRGGLYLVPDEVEHITGERVLIGGEFEDGEFIGGGVIYDECYKTFDALLADWPMCASQPVWSILKPPDDLELAWSKGEVQA